MFGWRNLIRRFSRSKHPSALLNESLFLKFDSGQPIESYDYVVFDTELTGLNTHRDEIVSIAAVRIVGMRIALDDTFHSLLRTRKRFMGEGTFVHKITPQEIMNAPSPEDVIPSFFDYCGSSVMIGHLPELDFSFLDRASQKIVGGRLNNPCLDSMALARYLWKPRQKKRIPDLPKIRSFNLVELSTMCEIPLFPSHAALADSLQTACLFLFLADRFKKLGWTTLHQFFRVGRIR